MSSLFSLSTTKQFLSDELPEVKESRRRAEAESMPLTEENAVQLLSNDEPDAEIMSRSLLNSTPSKRKRGSKESKESEWHDISVARMTPELEKDLKLLENRKHLDLKRFYKSSGRKKGELPTRVQVGKVVESAHEFYSGRLKRKERYETWMGELVADRGYLKKTKRKYLGIQEEKRPGNRVIDNNLGGARKRKKKW
eukprot:Plantae.Rhodophyta-Hildenbrandia_rubra.ctg47303.p1 GENE.Plantae.Rhodophyta-Hildenbrandia_rubra.ctg47303~~Plantae.Rhodophyta-Hildenbrandia_rubra.ctg47303.p1  ORF type:complete len:217 (+),score=44.14 Plantae.Rhodophyta-Hildenbrandia_rubra.ctg47303:65-652(+)